MTGRTVGAGTSITLVTLFAVAAQKAGIRSQLTVHINHMLQVSPLIRNGEISGHHTLQGRQPQHKGEQDGQQLSGKALHR